MKTASTSTLSYPITHNYRILATLAGGIIFQALFWQEKMGINTILFFAFIIPSLLLLYKTALSWKNSCWFLCASLITLAAVIIENTLLSKIAFAVSLLLLVVHTTSFYRSIHYTIAGFAKRVLNIIPAFSKEWERLIKGKTGNRAGKYNFRILILPLILTLLFTGIYLLASYVLADIASHIGDWLEAWLSSFINWISVPRLSFLLLGIFISAMLLTNHQSKLLAIENEEHDELIRKHISTKKSSSWNDIQHFVFGKSYGSMLALRLEYKGAIISLVLLNLLLLLVNITDIIFVWFNQTYKTGFEWAGFVHNGAEILVFSILLAMSILLYFFRGNLNFIRQNKTLKTIAYLWIFQNFMLTISVVVRNYYYVTHMGLAYKRIGLFVFAILVAAGLISIYLKINRRKTFYYLLRTNGWIAFIIFIGCSIVNWDEVIVKYNLSKKDEIPLDVAFLLQLNDKTLPILNQYRAYLASPQTALQRHYYNEYATGFLTGQLQWRKQDFTKEYNAHTWLSWNYADKSVHEYLDKESH